MRSLTASRLWTAIQAAVIVGCKEKTSTGEVNVPPPPPTALASASATVTATAIASAPPISTSITSPTQLQFGQRCLGKLLGALKPGKPVDSLELRLEIFQPEHTIMIAGQWGTPCVRAISPQKCRDALATPMRPAGSHGEWLVYTRVDEVGAVAGDEVAAFLAPIDTPEEAAMTLVYRQAPASVATVLPTCDPAAYKPVTSGFEMVDVQTAMCNETHKRTWTVEIDGAVKLTHEEHTPPTPNCNPRPFLGRRPEGLVEGGARGTELGAYFARCAALEAASVHAFRRLERELRAAGAPRRLRERARRARRDEIRHARQMRALARRFGGEVERSRVPCFEERALEDVALENVIEGCVSEACGAMIAAFQAARAKDASVRSVMRAIARDETQHAALAMDLADFLAEKLTPEARARVEQARARAARELTFAEPSPALAEIAGLPTRAQAQAMTRSLFPTAANASSARST